MLSLIFLISTRTLNSFRFIWKDYQLGLSCGVAYTTEKNLIKNLSQAIKHLNTQSYISLMQGNRCYSARRVPVIKLSAGCHSSYVAKGN